MKESITILLTGVGGPGAPGYINCYRRNNERKIKIIGADMSPNAAARGLVDVFYTIPKAGSEDYMPRVFEICQKESVDIIIPCVTKELAAFSANRELFDSINVRISVMDTDILSIVNDKGNLLKTIRELNLPCADYRMVNNTKELKAAVYDLGYPEKQVCIKVTNGNGSRGFRIIDTPENCCNHFLNDKPEAAYITYNALEELLKNTEMPSMMVMEYLPGDEYTVDVVANEDKVLAMVCRRGLKIVSSNQVHCVIEKNDSVIQLCQKIIDELKLVGQFGFDIRCDADNNPYVLEINPRLTSGIIAAAAAGCNLPYYEVLRLLGEPLPEFKINNGTTMIRHWKEEFFSPDGNLIDF